MRICLAPMDGITDCAYRNICKQVFQQYGNPEDELMLWTEFMSADGYMHNPAGVVRHLLKTDYEPETIVQIFGGNPDTLIACAQDLDQRYDFAGIEINMGCPSPKIMKCEAGSGMLKDKKRTLSILQQLDASITTPLSLKTRVGLNPDDKHAQFDFLLEASQYVGLIGIHGRTYGQSHSGEVDREFIYNIKKELPHKVIIGNGGIRSYDQAQEQLGNLDGIMIGQSAIGNPWILTPHTPTPHQTMDIIIQHLQFSVAAEIYFKEQVVTWQGQLIMPTLIQFQEIQLDLEARIPHYDRLVSVIEFRKYLFNYIKGLPDSKQLKQQIIKIRDYHGLITLLNDYFTRLIDNENL